MKTRIGIVLLTLLLAVTGCDSTGPRAKSPKLDELAARFKADAGRNRIAEGRKIAALLPVSPEVHWHKYWWLYLGFAEDVSIEWQNPSYRLPANDFLPRLGTPDHQRSFNIGEEWNYATYLLGRDRKGDAWGLYVHSCDGLVVSGFVMKTNTPAMISTRSHPDGSVTAVTNYME